MDVDVDYADDIVLVATSSEAPQALPHQAAAFAPFGLRFSADKSHVVWFHRPQARVTPFPCSVGSNPISVADHATFLGIAFHASKGHGHAFGLKQ